MVHEYSADSGAEFDRLRRTIAAGATKFVLIPLARGTREITAQLDRLVAEVIPVVENS